ncbi:MAG: restriction endonuclease [Candidatus Pacebacteria bacterium]|nr:restriction endonuclease [Candidatus Paceibacterota bacterium]
MAGHLFNINFWEAIKSIFGGAFQVVWLFIKSFWWVFLVLILIRVIPWLVSAKIRRMKNAKRFKAGEAWRSDRDLIYWLRGMSPTEFEEYIADLFSKLGYKTKVTGGSHDGGVDVIAEKDGIAHYIQCKKYFSKHEVGSPEVRNFYGAIADHLAKGKGYFITTNKFTLEAEQFAQDKPIELIDSHRLVDYIHLAEKAKI